MQITAKYMANKGNMKAKNGTKGDPLRHTLEILSESGRYGELGRYGGLKFSFHNSFFYFIMIQEIRLLRIAVIQKNQLVDDFLKIAMALAL